MTRKKIAIFFTFLLLALAICAGFWYVYTKKDMTYQITLEKNIASTVIILPNGQEVHAEFERPKELIQGWIGIKFSELTPIIKRNLDYKESGIYIYDTYLDSPAQLSGILPGDILLKINEQTTDTVIPTLNLIASLIPGKTYNFLVYRQGEYKEYPVIIDKKINL